MLSKECTLGCYFPLTYEAEILFYLEQSMFAVLINTEQRTYICSLLSTLVKCLIKLILSWGVCFVSCNFIVLQQKKQGGLFSRGTIRPQVGEDRQFQFIYLRKLATSMLFTYIFIYLSCINVSYKISVYWTCVGGRKTFWCEYS